jgi:hypothetical protein
VTSSIVPSVFDRKHQAGLFINRLYGCYGAGYVELRCLKRGKVHNEWYELEDSLLSPWDWINPIVDKAIELDDCGWDVYVGVLPRARQSGKAADVYCAGWVFADVDFHGEAEAPYRTLIERYTPDITVETGGGVHCYKTLSPINVVPVTDQYGLRMTLERSPLRDLKGKKAAEYLGTLKRYAAVLHADKAAAEPARILRVPGTRNHKPERNGYWVTMTKCFRTPCWWLTKSVDDAEYERKLQDFEEAISE